MSSAIISASITAFFTGRLMDMLGRRGTIILSDLFFIAGNFTIAFATEIYHLYLGRLIIGVGLGTGMTVMSVYIAECSPNKLRGTIISLCVMMVFGGMTLSYTMAIVSEFHHQVLFCFIAVPAVVQLLLLIFVQGESPVYLVMCMKDDQAFAHIKTYYLV